MKLFSRRKLPPGGFPYVCSKCGWSIKNPLNIWTEIVKEIAKHRANNPKHELATDKASVEADLEAYVCSGLDGKWCSDGSTTGTTDVQTNRRPRGRKACPTCGRRKKRP